MQAANVTCQPSDVYPTAVKWNCTDASGIMFTLFIILRDRGPRNRLQCYDNINTLHPRYSMGILFFKSPYFYFYWLWQMRRLARGKGETECSTQSINCLKEFQKSFLLYLIRIPRDLKYFKIYFRNEKMAHKVRLDIIIYDRILRSLGWKKPSGEIKRRGRNNHLSYCFIYLYRK